MYNRISDIKNKIRQVQNDYLSKDVKRENVLDTIEEMLENNDFEFLLDVFNNLELHLTETRKRLSSIKLKQELDQEKLMENTIEFGNKNADKESLQDQINMNSENIKKWVEDYSEFKLKVDEILLLEKMNREDIINNK